jgi:hypothetical protein
MSAIINFFKKLFSGGFAVKPVEKKPIGKLAIIYGHEKKAGGAFSKTMGMDEYRFHTEYVGPHLVEKALRLGFEVKEFFRDGVGIHGVGKLVNKWADAHTVAIELHFNAGGGKYSLTLYDSDPQDNLGLAVVVHKAMCAVFNRTFTVSEIKRLSAGDRGSSNLTSVACTSVLVEPAFGDVESEAKMLWQKRKEYAECLAQAAHDFIVGNKPRQ